MRHARWTYIQDLPPLVFSTNKADKSKNLHTESERYRSTPSIKAALSSAARGGQPAAAAVAAPRPTARERIRSNGPHVVHSEGLRRGERPPREASLRRER